MQTTAISIEVIDQGQLIRLSFEDMMRYHGPAFPGGVAHAFKVMTDRTPAEDTRLSVLKQEMADRLMSRPAAEVYDVDPS